LTKLFPLSLNCLKKLNCSHCGKYFQRNGVHSTVQLSGDWDVGENKKICIMVGEGHA